MSSEGTDPIGTSQGWEELADLLCDQFVALGHRRPAVARVVGDGNVILLVIGWSQTAGEELLAEVAPVLAELVGLDLHRRIVGLGTSVTDDGCRALVSFILGQPIEERIERFEAVQGWCRQVQRNARHQQVEHRRRHHEMRRLRAEMTMLRAELRAHRRTTPHREQGDRLLSR